MMERDDVLVISNQHSPDFFLPLEEEYHLIKALSSETINAENLMGISCIVLDKETMQKVFTETLDTIISIGFPIPIIVLCENKKEGEKILTLREDTLLEVLYKKELTPYLLSKSIEFCLKLAKIQLELNAVNFSKNFDVTHNSLTRLPNRALLFESVEHAIHDFERTQKSFAVMALDIVGFKNINDSLGHNVGDRVLKIVAERLKNNTRKTDTVAHLGGDEFVVVLSHAQNRDITAEIVSRLLEVLSQPFTLEKQFHYLMVNIGIALFPGDGNDKESLLKNADAALERSKKEGKNNFLFYNESFHQASYKRLVLANELCYALENNQFSLHYQPIIDTLTKKTIAFEALSRWNHPEKGNIPPLDFIPVAEETQLIVPLGNWAFATGLNYLSTLLSKQHKNISIAINLSPLQLKDNRIIHDLLHHIQEKNLPAEKVTLEITETDLMKNIDSTLENIKHLKSLGFKIAIDDFGTGFSSFSYLKDLPIDKLKIDKSFVKDLNEQSVDKDIVQTMLSLAKSLKLEVVAEGVETLKQAKILSELGCPYMQGFYYSPPLPEDKALEYITLEDPEKAPKK